MALRSDLSGGISLRFTAAIERGRELAGRPLGGGRPAPPPRPGRRIRVVGDPQTSLERFLQVLDAHELLGVDGFLADDVQLVSIGDHFDYGVHDHTDPRTEGLAMLRWLAEHAPAQVVILLGNHDAARVMELAGMTDARFRAAQAASDDELVASFPDVPAPGLVRRDYGCWTEAQRQLVAALLLADRYRLATVGVLADGREALISHAGITDREVAELGVAVTPTALAAALDRRLRDAVGARRDDWSAGRWVPLDLRPLHHAGEAPHEGGGLLYHRPSNPARDPVPGDPVDRVWEADSRRRRYHPRELPRGLVQIAGHTTHRACLRELRPWLSEAAVMLPGGGLRTLVVDGDQVLYDAGITSAGGAIAVLHLIDASMNDAEQEPEDYPLLELTSLA